MPAELSRAVGMHAISDLHSSLPLRLLNKGPEYLRRQLEAGKPGRKSAVERLAADKAKYVKSQQVISRRQEPVIALSSASESSSETCSVGSTAASRQRGSGTGAKPQLGKAVSSCRAPLQHGPPIARRGTRRQMRPDSLVIYRQKCELGRGQSQDSPRGSLVRRIFNGSVKEKQLASPELPRVMEDVAATEGSEPLSVKDGDQEPSDHGAGQAVPVSTEGAGVCTKERETPSKLSAPPEEVKEVKRRGLHRSQSDISSRYSKCLASDFDTFFKYCGLEQEVIEDLGRENFSVVSDNVSFKIRSISVATSDSEFTRHSGDEGLLEDELTEQVPSSTSVVERNARIIKWLYTCKKAKENNKVIQELA